MAATAAQTQALVEFFRNQGRKTTYKKCEFVIRPGEAPGAVFYIDTGLVKAYDITKYGEENLLVIRKEHEIFPLIWALTGSEKHIIYEALVPSTVWQVSRELFLSNLAAHSEMLAPLLDMAIEAYRIHSERIENLEYRTVRERIISFLLTMDRRFGSQDGNKSTILAPLRHQDIASSVNASRETVSRELAGLERRQLISSEQSLITLQDLDALHKLLSPV